MAVSYDYAADIMRDWARNLGVMLHKDKAWYVKNAPRATLNEFDDASSQLFTLACYGLATAETKLPELAKAMKDKENPVAQFASAAFDVPFSFWRSNVQRAWNQHHYDFLGQQIHEAIDRFGFDKVVKQFPKVDGKTSEEIVTAIKSFGFKQDVLGHALIERLVEKAVALQEAAKPSNNNSDQSGPAPR